MNAEKHRLCIILDELEHDDEAPEPDTETEGWEAEQDEWQFDPGICG